MVLPNKILFIIVALALVFVFAGSGILFAQQFEYVDYTVKKGDTLWGITKEHLEDAFQWPLVWRENLRINNPDLIYPGQVIHVPVRVIGPSVEKVSPGPRLETGEPVDTAAQAPPEKELPEKAVQEEAEEAKRPKWKPWERRDLRPRKAKELVSREFILESGYITSKLPDYGQITDSPRGRTEFGQFDDIYVKTKNHVEPGTKFYVVSNEGKVRHPMTGHVMGYLAHVKGTVEIKEAGTRGLQATVVESFEALSIGDSLDLYFEVHPPFVAGEPRKPEINAYVVASRYLRTLNGQFDVVFIDKGVEDGFAVGDVVMTLLQGTDDYKNATVQLINLRRSTSLALVLHNKDEIKFGDVVISAESE